MEDIEDVKYFLTSQHLALLDTVKGVIEGKKKWKEARMSVIANLQREANNELIDDILKDLEIK